MQDRTVIIVFAALIIAISYAANFLAAKQASIRHKRLIGVSRSVLVAALFLGCGFVLSHGDDSFWIFAVLVGLFLIVQLKRTKYCPACGTRNTTKFGVPNEVCRNCGTSLR